MNAELSKAMSEQINKEYYSAFLYLAIANRCSDNGLKGASNWMYAQYHEELAHAQGIYQYMQTRSEPVAFAAIDDPSGDWDNLLDVFKKTLAHEQFVTDSINNLASIAMKVNDHAAYIFLQWYVTEQVEEEGNANDWIDRLTLAADNTNALLNIDEQLSTRVFAAPVIPHTV